MITTRIIKNTYLEGQYEFRDLSTTNWASPIDCPTVFVAYGQAIKSGNWRSCTAINTPDSLCEYVNENTGKGYRSNYDIPYLKLTDSERYEFAGLVYAIASLNDAWSVVNSGNHGTSNGTDITNNKAADAIIEALKVPVERANELLAKMRS